MFLKGTIPWLLHILIFKEVWGIWDLSNRWICVSAGCQTAPFASLQIISVSSLCPVFLLSLLKESKLLSIKLKDVQVVDHHIKELSVCTDLEKIFCCVTKFFVAHTGFLFLHKICFCVINDFCLHCMYSSTTRQCTVRGPSFPEDISSQWNAFSVIMELFLCSVLVGVCKYLLLLYRYLSPS